MTEIYEKYILKITGLFESGLTQNQIFCCISNNNDLPNIKEKELGKILKKMHQNNTLTHHSNGRWLPPVKPAISFGNTRKYNEY